jgi:DNA repair protein RadC
MAGGRKKKGAPIVELHPHTPQEEQWLRLLEELLGFVLPQGKAGETAQQLMGLFGGPEGLFRAPQEELVRAVGVEPARYLRLTMELAKVYMEDSARDLHRVFDTPSAVDLFAPKFLGRSTEAVGLMLLDSRGRLLYNDILTEGSVSSVPIYIRRLLQLCISYDAQNVMLAHNHPSGNPCASRNDIVATRQVQMALEAIDATLHDHIIFAGADYLSFADCGLLESNRRDLDKLRRGVMDAARTAEYALLEKGKLS